LDGAQRALQPSFLKLCPDTNRLVATALPRSVVYRLRAPRRPGWKEPTKPRGYQNTLSCLKFLRDYCHVVLHLAQSRAQRADVWQQLAGLQPVRHREHLGDLLASFNNALLKSRYVDLSCSNSRRLWLRGCLFGCFYL